MNTGRKLTFAQAEIIRSSEEPNMILSKKYRVSAATISQIKNGLTHRCRITINLSSDEMRILQLMAGSRLITPGDMAKRFINIGLQDYETNSPETGKPNYLPVSGTRG